MPEKNIKLSDRATDVLYALFFRGALQSGNLPSKSGVTQLRDLGLAETRHTATPYQGENYFTFLTAEGQKFAIENLVKTRFGVPVGGYLGETSGKLYSAGIGISIEGDQRKVVFEADRFKVNEAAQSAIKNAAVCSWKITVSAVLSDEMKQAVNDAVGDAIRNMLRPGGLLYGKR
ncbi:DUF1983 domain-containing protein [Escherichia coli]|nr:DUF1983 domain-containing protein [Escherichia coli]EFN4108035.1 DUF1983 domain-containing protein [Escherichia coli]